MPRAAGATPKGKFGFITDLKRLAGDPLSAAIRKSRTLDPDQRRRDAAQEAKAGPLTDQKTDIRSGSRRAPGMVGGRDLARRPVHAEPTSRVRARRIGAWIRVPSSRSLSDRAAAAGARGVAERRAWAENAIARGAFLPMAEARGCSLAADGLGARLLHGRQPEQLLLWHQRLGTAAGVLAPPVAWLSGATRGDAERACDGRSWGWRCWWAWRATSAAPWCTARASWLLSMNAPRPASASGPRRHGRWRA